MTKKALTSIVLGAVLSTTAAFAINNNFDTHPITANVVTRSSNKQLPSANLPQTKPVVFMNIQLTPEQRKHFLNFSSARLKPLKAVANDLPVRIDLGMNKVPVLDQGQHGTCVTFANTAAIDALLDKGDYVSQLCTLELGTYLSQRGYFPSGWEGTWGSMILNQILQFGIVNKDTQKSQSCAGLIKYPDNEADNTGKAMSLDEYKSLSEDMSYRLSYESFVTPFQRFEYQHQLMPFQYDKQAEEVLINVKKALSKQMNGTVSRVTFAVLLPVEHCSGGACGTYHQKYDTWVLTDAIAGDTNPLLGGHEMVITGYDDEAIAKDEDQTVHKGLLILRNSWGADVGDTGTYYMSYDFFKHYLLEAQKVTAMQGF